MRKIEYLMIALLLPILLVYGQTSADKMKSELQEGWENINDTEYSIQYPGDWYQDKSGQMGMSFILLSKQTSQNDNFRENVNLLIQDLAGYNINLDQFVDISEAQIKTLITNGILLESKRLEADGISFQKVIYTGEQGVYKLKFEQYYWVKNEKAYVLTLTCESNQFDDYKVIGEKIMDSFKMK